MKVTTEKRPRSILALTVELEKDQIEKALDRAARRMSQKYNIPGFRKGKAPRFIIENYFGRSAMLEEATDDLINKAFREAIDQEKIEPYAQPRLVDVSLEAEPFQFTVEVPVPPTVTLPDYRQFKAEYALEDVTDAMLQQALDTRRERHVVLRALEEPRPAQQGDQLTVELETFIEGKLVDERPEGTAPPRTNLILEPGRLVSGLYEGLVGLNAGDLADITTTLPEDHSNEEARGKEARFVVNIIEIQERLLPEWDELPALENVEGTIDDLREKTRGELADAARQNAENQTVDKYVEQVIAATEFDIPDAYVEQEADRILTQRESEYARYGIRPEQVYEIQGRKREDLLEELMPQAAERARSNLVLREIIRAEELVANEDELNAEVERFAAEYAEERREEIKLALRTELMTFVASNVMDRKLRRRLLVLATGDPSFEQAAEEAAPAEETSSATDAAVENANDASEADADATPAGTDTAEAEKKTE